MLDNRVEYVIKDICLDITERYEIEFIEIGTDKDHIHFLIQTIPALSPTKIVTIIKSLTAKEIFIRAPHVKKELWGGSFWSSGYFINTVSQHANEETIMNYVKNQGKEKEYTKLHQQKFEM